MDTDQYILEINKYFIELGGSDTIAIPYDADEKLLDNLLQNINGALFTGGVLDLIDPETHEQH